MQIVENELEIIMFVVAYLYSKNGMGTWCWEAAHALHEAHQPVLLVCSNEVELPGNPAVDIVRFPSQSLPSASRSPLSRIVGELGRLSENSSGFVYQLQQLLFDLGIIPTAYFLNQSNLQDPRVDVPQYVVAWSYPSSFKGYISKLGKLTGWQFSTTTVRQYLDLVGWWRKDWRAYRSATFVMAVCQRLQTELASQGVKVDVVYPGTFICTEKSRVSTGHTYKLLIVSLNLEEPRKRVRWMVEALKSAIEKNFTLTLVGSASEAFKSWVCSVD